MRRKREWQSEKRKEINSIRDVEIRCNVDILFGREKRYGIWRDPSSGNMIHEKKVTLDFLQVSGYSRIIVFHFSWTRRQWKEKNATHELEELTMMSITWQIICGRRISNSSPIIKISWRLWRNNQRVGWDDLAIGSRQDSLWRTSTCGRKDMIYLDDQKSLMNHGSHRSLINLRKRNTNSGKIENKHRIWKRNRNKELRIWCRDQLFLWSAKCVSLQMKCESVEDHMWCTDLHDMSSGILKKD